MSQIAVLGLGIIGSRVCEQLRSKGFHVQCWSRTPRGIEGETDSARAAVFNSDFIALYLKDSEATKKTVLSILDSVKTGAVLINHSTIDLLTTRWLAEVCATRGIDFLDAPFTGSKMAAQNGQLFYYTSGNKEVVDKCSAVLAASSKGSMYCGEIGSATVLKLVTNLISATTVQALSEAMGIALKHGISADLFMLAVANNACSSTLSGMKLPTMATGDFTPHFSMDNMRKDSVYALALAKEVDCETPAIVAVSQRMEEMCAKGYAEQDYSALIKAYVMDA